MTHSTTHKLLLITLAFAGACFGAIGMHLLIRESPQQPATAGETGTQPQHENSDQIPFNDTAGEAIAESAETPTVTHPRTTSTSAETDGSGHRQDTQLSNTDQQSVSPPEDGGGSSFTRADPPVFTTEPSPRPPESAFPEVAWQKSDAGLALAHAPAAMGTQGEAFSFPSQAIRTAYDPVSGQFAALLKDGGLVVYAIQDIIEGRLAPAAVMQVQRGADLIFHRYREHSYLLVVENERPQIIVINTKSMEEAARIDMTEVSAGIPSLSCSRNPADPFVYFRNGSAISGVGRTFGNAICRISLETMQFDSALHRSSAWQKPFQVSDDGQTIQISTGSGQFTSVRWGDVGEDRFAMAPEILHSGSLSVGRTDQFPLQIPDQPQLLAGHSIVTPVFHFPCGERIFDFDVLTWCTEKSVAAGVNVSLEICLANSRTGKTWARIPLPPSIRQARQTSGSRYRSAVQRRTQWFDMDADPGRDLLIAASDSQLMIVPMTHRDAKLEAALTLPQRPPLQVSAGKPVAIPLQMIRSDTGEPVPVTFHPQPDPLEGVRNPSPIAVARGKMTIGLASSDTEAKSGKAFVRDGRLNWIPSTEQLGPAVLKVIAKGPNDLQSELNLEFYVRSSPEVVLPFYAQRLFLSHDGSLAFIWGTEDKSSAFHGKQISSALRDNNRVLPEAQLALVDTATSRIIARRPWPTGVYTAAVGQEHVFIVDYPTANSRPGIYDGTSRIVQLGVNDLQEQAETVVTKPPMSVLNINDQYLALTDGRQLSIPGLRQLSEKSEQSGIVADGYIHRGILWNATLDTPLLMTTPLAFCSDEVVGHPQSRFRFQLPDRSGIRLTTVGRYTSTWLRSITFGSGNATLPLSDSVSWCREYPGKFTVTDRTTVNLLFNAEGRLHQAERVLNARSRVNIPGTHPAHIQKSNAELIENAPGIVVTAIDKNVYIRSTEGMLPAEPPFHLKEEQSAFVLQPEKVTTLTYECPNATRYSLEVGYSENGTRLALFNLISETGSFEIKPALTTKLTHLAAQVARSTGSRDSTVAIPACLQKCGRLFHQLTGRRPAGIPLPLYAIVRANDAAGRQAALVHWILLEVPVAQVEELIANYSF